MKRMKNKNIIAAVIAFCLCASAMPVNILAANEKIEESTEKRNYSIGEIGGYLEGSIKTVRQMENERLFSNPTGHGFAAEQAFHNVGTIEEAVKKAETLSE